MTWIEPISTAMTAASLAVEISKSSGAIIKHARRISYRLRKGQLIIPIFGAGGVGKTTAGRIFGGENPLDMSSEYRESIDEEIVDLKGDIPGKIVVGPGQHDREFSRVDRAWPAMYRSIVEGRANTIVNVVSYGYHSFLLNSYKDHALYKRGMSVPEFMDVYTEKRRAAELDLAETLVAGVSAAEGPIFFLTVVNKQDLWWNCREEVRAFYEAEYSEIIKKIGKSLGGQRFQHEILPSSLTLGNLMSESGELLAETTAGYDMQKHVLYMSSLFGVLASRSGQKTKK